MYLYSMQMIAIYLLIGAKIFLDKSNIKKVEVSISVSQY